MSKKRIFRLLFCILVLAFFFRLYITTLRVQQPKDSLTRTIVDMSDRRIQVADPLERIALLGGPTGQIAFVLGVQDKLCAVTNTLKMSKLVQEVYPAIEELPGPRTTSGNINIEELIRSNPDIVISGGVDGEIVRTKTRIPVAFLDSNMGVGIEDLKKEVDFYACIFQTPYRAERFSDSLDRMIRFVKDRVKDIPENEKKSVFQGYNPSHLVTLGGDTFMQERIEIAGCKNAAKSVTTIGERTGLHSGLGEVSMEQVLEWNPDILVINYGGIEDLYGDPQWRHIRAVREKKVFHQPAGVFIFNRPTAESAAIFPLWLASIAYPERFEDVSIVQMVMQFYKEVMDFDLTQQQARDILSGAYESRMMKGIKHQRRSDS